jgi:hypothetical protein
MPRCDIQRSALLVFPLIAGGLVFLSGCPGETPKPNVSTNASSGHEHKEGHGDDDHDHDGDHHHHHAEKGPHGGALVAIGHDDAHVEIVLDADSGALKAYILDGEAEKPVAIKQEHLQLAVTLGKKTADDDKSALPEDALIVTLTAVSPDDGKATEFEGQRDELKGAEKFDAVLTAIKVGDKPFNNVNFNYPEGNEDHHH